MSTSSSNVRITCDRPKEVIDRWIRTRGVPVSARSRGIVTRSRPPRRPGRGRGVMTMTCTLVTSGNASIFRWRKVSDAEDGERQRSDQGGHAPADGEVDQPVEHSPCRRGRGVPVMPPVFARSAPGGGADRGASARFRRANAPRGLLPRQFSSTPFNLPRGRRSARAFDTGSSDRAQHLSGGVRGPGIASITRRM